MNTTQSELLKFKLECERYWKEQAKPQPNQLLTKPNPIGRFKGYSLMLAQKFNDAAKAANGK